MKSSNRALATILCTYDGSDTLSGWVTNASEYINGRNLHGEGSGVYGRLISHANSIGMEVEMLPEGSKLMLNIIIKI